MYIDSLKEGSLYGMKHKIEHAPLLSSAVMISTIG